MFLFGLSRRKNVKFIKIRIVQKIGVFVAIDFEFDLCRSLFAG